MQTGRSQQRPAQLVDLIRLELFPACAREVEHVDCSLTVCRDMRRVNIVPLIVNGRREGRQQRRTIVRIDFYDRRSSRCALCNIHRRSDFERRTAALGLGRRQWRRGVARQCGLDGFDQAGAQSLVRIGLAATIQYLQVIECHAIARCVNSRIDDVGSGYSETSADSVE